MQKLYIITTSDLPNHVILGHASFAKKAGLNPVFIFPDRGNDTKYDYAYSGYECVKLKTFFDVKSYFSYIISLTKLLFEVSKYLKEYRNGRILAVDFECTIICIFLKFKGHSIYSLINDNFAIRYKFPKLFFYVINFLEGFSYKYISEMCIFPDQCRYDLLGLIKPSKYIIIPNVLDSNVGDISYSGDSSSNLYVLLCGWLESTRGLDILEDIISKTNENVFFVLSGNGNYTSQKPEILSNKRIIFKGLLTRLENLKLMSIVDINFCFYNPEIIINRFALPQKVSDSILIGCPIFINSEVSISKDLVMNNVAISSKYRDIDEISNKLNSLVTNKISLKLMSKNIFEYRSKQQTFAEVEKNAINEYKKLLF